MITHINPVGSMDLLSQLEVDRLKQTASSDIYQLFRNCSLAVLNSGSHTDSSKEILERFKSFDIHVIRRERGVKLELFNAPEHAFVDGEIIRGIQEHLFSVLRDILYVSTQLESNRLVNLTSSTTSPTWCSPSCATPRRSCGRRPNLVVCWGGHSINEIEYQYTRAVGSELGLRELNICTGCGPGAMEGPMKGAAVGHAKQRVRNGRYIGSPSLPSSPPSRPTHRQRAGDPAGHREAAGGLRAPWPRHHHLPGRGRYRRRAALPARHHDASGNERQPMPIILTGPKESADYFRAIDDFVKATLGEPATSLYRIIVGDAPEVARVMKEAMPKIREYRKSVGDAYSFNWSLKIEPEFQLPFEPDHANMASLDLHRNQPPQLLAANLRRAFSGIVAGNVKEGGIRAIEKKGPFKLHGDKELMHLMDKLLESFVKQQRMKLPGSQYVPCYEIVR